MCYVKNRKKVKFINFYYLHLYVFVLKYIWCIDDMIKKGYNSKIISGALAFLGAGTTLVSANTPQHEQKNGGNVNKTNYLKALKGKKILRRALIAIDIVLGVVTILVFWAYIHKLVAINDLDKFLKGSALKEIKQRIPKITYRVEIEKLKTEINSFPVIEENGIKVDPRAITYEKLEKVLRNFGEYSESTNKKIAEINANFFKVLKNNINDLEILLDDSDIDKIKDANENNILETFDNILETLKTFLICKNSKEYTGLGVSAIKNFFINGTFQFLIKEWPDLPKEVCEIYEDRENFYEDYFDYLLGKNGKILSKNLDKKVIKTIENCKKIYNDDMKAFTVYKNSKKYTDLGVSAIKNSFINENFQFLIEECPYLPKKVRKIYKNLENFCEDYFDYLLAGNDKILSKNLDEEVIKTLKYCKKNYDDDMKAFTVLTNNIIPAFYKAKNELLNLENDTKLKKERTERLKTKEKLECLLNKHKNILGRESLLGFAKEEAKEMAEERKNSLENNFWDFGNNFFKLHGNDDLLQFS